MNIDAVAEAIRVHRLESGPNWDTKWRCSCDPTLEFVTKRDQALHVAAAAIAALQLTEETRREEGDDLLWADEHRLVSPWVREEQP